jgi:hypothetical protein
MTFRYEAECEVWAYPGKAGWHFVSLPTDLTAPLKHVRGGQGSAWGSMRVEATIGASTWRTSLFPDTRSGAFLLPLKAEIRRRERLSAGDRVRVTVEIGL